MAILSHAMWRRLFNRDPAILGKTVLLRGAPHEVIGVMTEGFTSTRLVDLWTPLRPSRTGEGGGSNYAVVVRVNEGVTWAEAEADVRAAGNGTLRSQGADVQTWLSLVPMQRALVADAEPIVMLGGAVLTVLLIACVNLAALLLARGGSRAKEIATRMALGSGPAAVIRQLMTESLVLAFLGGALGIAVGYGAIEALKALGGEIFDDWRRAAIDGRVVGVTAAISLLTSVVFGLAPAIQASRLDVQRALAEGGTRGVTGGTRHWLRRSLIVGEVALGVALLVTAGLLLRTFVNLRSLNPGFDTRNLVTASASMQDARYATAERVNRLIDDTLRHLERAPGVESAAVSLGVPYERLLNLGFRIIGPPASMRNTIANVSYVTPRFFDTLRIPVKRGRAVTAADGAGAPPVIVINETFGRIFFAEMDPIGRRIRLSGAEREIVGIVGDVQQSGSGFFLTGMVRGPLTNAPQIYLPAAQTNDAMLKLVHTWFTPVWTVRTSRVAEGSAALRQAIVNADPQLPIADIRTMAAVMNESMGSQRLLMTLVGVLAGAALLLSAIGIYGLIAHSIAERSREIGIRMALGATAARTIRSAAMSGIALASAGVALGALLAYYSTRLVQSFLWRVDSHDPLTFAGVAVLFLTVAAAASVLPALRILRLDPAATLRG